MLLVRRQSGQREQRESSELEAVWGRIDPTTLSTTPGAFVLGLLYPSGSLLPEKMRTAHVVISYLNVVRAFSESLLFLAQVCFHVCVHRFVRTT